MDTEYNQAFSYRDEIVALTIHRETLVLSQTDDHRHLSDVLFNLISIDRIDLPSNIAVKSADPDNNVISLYMGPEVLKLIYAGPEKPKKTLRDFLDETPNQASFSGS